MRSGYTTGGSTSLLPALGARQYQSLSQYPSSPQPPAAAAQTHHAPPTPPAHYPGNMCAATLPAQPTAGVPHRIATPPRPSSPTSPQTPPTHSPPPKSQTAK